MKIIYALVFKDTGEIVNAKLFKQYWVKYGSNSVYGWRMPKKMYETLGRAKAGFSHVPEQLKPLIDIAEFVQNKVAISGNDLMEEKKNRSVKLAAKKEEKEKKRDYADLHKKIDEFVGKTSAEDLAKLMMSYGMKFKNPPV